jgi:hypothetical protein
MSLLRLLAILLMAPALVQAAAPKAAAPTGPTGDTANADRIRKYKFEITPIEYRGRLEKDPFIPGVPLRAGFEGGGWKVRIGTLKLSSVIMGKQKVAVFKEMSGPRYSYILLNGILVGPDHKPIPGIEGTIEKLGSKGDYRVILRQGADSVIHTLANENAKYHRSRRAGGGSQSDSDKNENEVGGAE